MRSRREYHTGIVNPDGAGKASKIFGDASLEALAQIPSLLQLVFGGRIATQRIRRDWNRV